METWCRLQDGQDSPLYSTISSIEVDNGIIRLEDDISEDGIYRCRCIVDEDNVGGGGIEYFSSSFASCIQQRRKGIKQVLVWCGFYKILIMALLGLNLARDGAIRTLIKVLEETFGEEHTADHG